MDLASFDLDSTDTCIMMLFTIAITFVYSLLHPYIVGCEKKHQCATKIRKMLELKKFPNQLLIVVPFHSTNCFRPRKC